MSANLERGLSPQQLQAAVLLAQGMPQNQVAEAVGCSQRSLQNWKKLEAFTAEIERRAELKVEGLRAFVGKSQLELAKLTPTAVQVLGRLLTDVDEYGMPTAQAGRVAEIVLRGAGVFTVERGEGAGPAQAAAIVVIGGEEATRVQELRRRYESVILGEAVEEEDDSVFELPDESA